MIHSIAQLVKIVESREIILKFIERVGEREVIGPRKWPGTRMTIDPDHTTSAQLVLDLQGAHANSRSKIAIEAPSLYAADNHGHVEVYCRGAHCADYDPN